MKKLLVSLTASFMLTLGAISVSAQVQDSTQGRDTSTTDIIPLDTTTTDDNIMPMPTDTATIDTTTPDVIKVTPMDPTKTDTSTTDPSIPSTDPMLKNNGQDSSSTPPINQTL